jgi:hypothetical protein
VFARAFHHFDCVLPCHAPKRSSKTADYRSGTQFVKILRIGSLTLDK